MSTFASHDGLELAFIDEGPTGAPVALLLHGFAADTEANWRAPGLLGALVGAGRRVVALDARGHGRSAKPHDPAAYGGLAMALDAAALLDHLGITAVDLVGYSMGALTSSVVATREPRLRSLVLGGVGGNLRPPRRGQLPEALETDDPSSITDPVAKGFRRFADRTGADRFALAALQRSERPPAADLAHITVPTLVLVGEADALVGDPGELAAAIPGAKAVITPGDHLTAVFEPTFARALLGFLDEVSPLPVGEARR